MRRVRLRATAGPARLELVEEERPRPGAGEILVRVRACSLNFRDLMMVMGHVPYADNRVPLSDAAGDVVAVGDEVEDFRPGDAVVSTFYPFWTSGEPTAASRRVIPGDSVDGYAGDYVCKPANYFIKAPPGLAPTEAAALTCTGLTAWRGLVTHGRVRPGDTVLTLGTGSVSLFALQFAKAAGARVIATSSSEEKLEKLSNLGADAVINYKAEPQWGRKAKDLTEGRGVDHVIEVGGPATLAQSIAACRAGGHIALIGVLTGFDAQVSIPALFSNEIRTSGVSIGSRADQREMMRALTANRLRPVIDSRFALEEVDAAFGYYETRRHFGKVCIEL